MPAKYHGKTHLHDVERGMVLCGNLFVSTSPSGRSEIRVRNDATGAERVLVFTSPEVRDCILKFLDAARAVHEGFEVPTFGEQAQQAAPTCISCRGDRRVCDINGDCTDCHQCSA